MATVATLESTDVQLVPGDVVAVTLRLENTGTIVENYCFEVIGTPEAWALVEPEKVPLNPGTSSTATITFRPPRAWSVPAGEQWFGVKVIPTERPDEAVVPEGVVEILPFLDTVAELVPRTSEGRRRGRHRVAIDNRGNMPVTARLHGQDDGQRLDISTKPSVVTVAPGAAQFVQVRVRPRTTLWRGSPETYQFAVAVASRDTSPISLAGSHVQQPLIPGPLVKALAALVAVVAALAAAWLFLLKPTIESQATEAAQAAVAGDAAAAKKAAQKASQSAGQATGSANAAKSSQKSAENLVGGSLPPNVQRVTTRLTSTGAQSDEFVIPAKRTMDITDLVFSNPQGDFGRAKVTLAGKPLFDIALENFRDLDQHFVTPITGQAGQSLQLEVTCRQPGRPPDGPAPTKCDIALLVSGEMVKLGAA